MPSAPGSSPKAAPIVGIPQDLQAQLLAVDAPGPGQPRGRQRDRRPPAPAGSARRRRPARPSARARRALGGRRGSGARAAGPRPCAPPLRSALGIGPARVLQHKPAAAVVAPGADRADPAAPYRRQPVATVVGRLELGAPGQDLGHLERGHVLGRRRPFARGPSQSAGGGWRGRARPARGHRGRLSTTSDSPFPAGRRVTLGGVGTSATGPAHPGAVTGSVGRRGGSLAREGGSVSRAAVAWAVSRAQPVVVSTASTSTTTPSAAITHQLEWVACGEGGPEPGMGGGGPGQSAEHGHAEGLPNLPAGRRDRGGDAGLGGRHARHRGVGDRRVDQAEAEAEEEVGPEQDRASGVVSVSWVSIAALAIRARLPAIRGRRLPRAADQAARQRGDDQRHRRPSGAGTGRRGTGDSPRTSCR